MGFNTCMELLTLNPKPLTHSRALRPFLLSGKAWGLGFGCLSPNPKHQTYGILAFLYTTVSGNFSHPIPLMLSTSPTSKYETCIYLASRAQLSDSGWGSVQNTDKERRLHPKHDMNSCQTRNPNTKFLSIPGPLAQAANLHHEGLDTRIAHSRHGFNCLNGVHSPCTMTGENYSRQSCHEGLGFRVLIPTPT